MQREIIEKLMSFCEYHNARIIDINLESSTATILTCTDWKKNLVFIDGEWDVLEG